MTPMHCSATMEGSVRSSGAPIETQGAASATRLGGRLASRSALLSEMDIAEIIERIREGKRERVREDKRDRMREDKRENAEM